MAGQAAQGARAATFLAVGRCARRLTISTDHPCSSTFRNTLMEYRPTVKLTLQPLEMMDLDFNSVCRFCLSAKDCIFLFLSNGKFNERLHKSFEIIAPKIDENDGLPNNICSMCVQQIENFVDFEANCIKSYEMLEIIIQKSMQDANNHPDDALQNIQEQTEIELLKEEIDASEYNDDYDEGLSDPNQHCQMLPELEGHPAPNDEIEYTTCRESIQQDLPVSTLEPSLYLTAENDVRILEEQSNETEEENPNTTDPDSSVMPQTDKDLYIMAGNVEASKYCMRQNRKIPIVRCMFCHKNYCGRNTLRKHLKIHFKMKDYTCDQCQRTFSDRTSLRVHEVRHSKVKSFKCDHCDQSFYTQSELKQHCTMKHTQRQFVCSVCGKRFPSHHVLEDHAAVHITDRPFKCSLCSQGFKRNRNLVKHLQVHARNNDINESAKLTTCNHCNVACERPSQLLTHLQQVHAREYRRVRLGTHRCTHCPCTFSTLDDFLAHQDKHHVFIIKTNDSTAFQCGGCDKQFRHMWKAARHLLTHSSERGFPCTENNCLKRYKSKVHLVRHQRFVH